MRLGLKLWLEIEILALEQFVKDGLAPAKALENVRKKASFSVARILEIEKEVKHDVIAFLTNVSEIVGDDGRYLHLGLTSSDVLDTSFAVQLTQAAKLINQGIDKLMQAIKQQAMSHKKYNLYWAFSWYSC
jgi:adenylosuccinate lyase